MFTPKTNRQEDPLEGEFSKVIFLPSDLLGKLLFNFKQKLLVQQIATSLVGVQLFRKTNFQN